MSNRTTRTPAKILTFLEVLQRTGQVVRACADASIPRQNVYEWREADPDFAQAWDDALEAYTEKLEAEADRRAVEGVDKPVFWRGQQVSTTKDYSDVLLMFRLNGLKPEKYRQRHEHTGKDGEPINVHVHCTFSLTEALQQAYVHRDNAPPALPPPANGLPSR